MVYLDNAATSFPKPQETIDAVNHFTASIGGNPGRGGNPLSIEAARIVYEARERLTRLLGGTKSERLIFTRNGTEALNLAILGVLNEGDHVITTSLEHNSVMRPLDHMADTRGVTTTVVPCSEKGELDLSRLTDEMRESTRMVIVNHGSNVIGSVQPVQALRTAIGDRPLLVVDACQTVGVISIDVELQGIDILCFSCHKSLYGIQGLGALYVKADVEPRPLVFGGTGSNSEFTRQPGMWPDKFESGTPGTHAIAALLGGLAFIEKVGIAEIRAKKKALQRQLVEGLGSIDRVRVYGDPLDAGSLPITSFTVEGVSVSDVGYECNRAGLCVRVGLHCAPLAHRTIRTFPGGSVRVSPGYFNTSADIDRLVELVESHAKQ